jgi:hypothetical protein
MFIAALAAGCLTAATASAQEPDGARFRGGISVGGGGLFVSGFSAGLGGIDGRMGAQINNLIGVYAQPHISFGAGKVGNATGFTGEATGDAVVDFTFLNQIFVGAGGGGGIIGSLPGANVLLRFGGYPVFTHGENHIRRKGLMLGADMRMYFFSVNGGGAQVLQAMASIGYEAF